MKIQGVRLQGTKLVPSGVAADEYFNLVSLLLPGNGTNGAQNNTFLDSSTNNFTVTRNGNTTQGTFSPFSQTGWSVFVNSAGSSTSTMKGLTTPNSTLFDMVNGGTVECWVYLTQYPAAGAPYFNSAFLFSFYGAALSGGSKYYGMSIVNTGALSIIRDYGGSNTDNTSSTIIPLNTWTHIAWSRISGSNYFFVNGTDITSTFTNPTLSGAWPASTTDYQLYIGLGAYLFNIYTYIGDFNGYISNFRVVKGSAVYSASFTPPTQPLTAVSGTSLLTCQSNRYIDNSTNALAITPLNTPSVQAFAPFDPTAAYSAATVGGSAYFDGTGDYLTAPYNSAWDFGTGDFTIESWLYRTALGVVVIAASFTNSGNDGWSFEINSSNQITFYAESAFVATSTATIPANTWTHVAVSRSGTTLRLFIDGAVATTVTYSTSIAGFSGLLAISATATGVAPFVGYQSNFRVVKGTAVYTSAFVPPTAPLTNITNTGFLLSCTNAGIPDATAKNVLETVGSAQISTAQSKFGGSSMSFDGSGDYLTFPSSQDFALGSTDFTVEYWINTAASADDGILQISTTPGGFATSYTNGLMMAVVSGVLYYALGGSSVNTSTTINNGNWRHIAMSRSGSSLKIFVDGTQVSSATNSNSVTGTYLVVGGYYSTSFTLNGYINDLRITRGYARYTANFTPPTTAFPVQ